MLSLEITALIQHTGPMATPRERARAEFTTDLLEAARARLVAEGAAGLSLRAVARDLGVSSSAVYRYVESRDALLTVLIIETYDEVGTVCETAAAAARADGVPAGQVLLAVARAFREWALAHRRSFELVYGTPVPGYAAPQDTVEHALRIWAVLVATLLEAQAEGTLGPVSVDVGPGLVEPGAVAFGAGVVAARGLQDVVGQWGEPEVVRAFTLFAGLVGAVTVELFGHLHRAAADNARVFDAMVALTASGVGVQVDVGA